MPISTRDATTYRPVSQIELQTISEGDHDDADAALRRKQDANRHLPLTSNTTARWFESAFHNITAMVGAGVLGLPFTFVSLGWAGGLAVMATAMIISYVTFAELVHLHEVPHPTDPDKPPERLCRYNELTSYAWGDFAGHLAILPFQIAVLVGLGITYTVVGGSSLASLAARSTGLPSSKTAGIVAFSAAEMLLAQLPSFNDLSLVSGMGALMSLAYSSIAVVLSLVAAQQQQQQQQQVVVPDHPLGGGSSSHFEFFNAVATIAFAFGGHNVALEIQSSLPCPPSTVPPMMRGVNLAYGVAFVCYFGVTASGFAAFGSSVAENVLDSIRRPVAVISAAEVAVVLHVAASYQVYSFPMFDMMQQALWQRGVRLGGVSAGLLRAAYVGFTCGAAALLPFFVDLMGLVGALGVTPTTFILPAVLWLWIKRPPVASLAFWGNVLIILLCLIVGLMGTISSLHLIRLHWADYQLRDDTTE